MIPRQFKLSEAEKYIPYSKTTLEGQGVKVNRSGYISLSEQVYRQWVFPNKKVALYYDATRRWIGIRPDPKEGLALVRAGRWKRYYVSARGFLKKFKIHLERDLKAKDVNYDPQNKVIIVPL